MNGFTVKRILWMVLALLALLPLAACGSDSSGSIPISNDQKATPALTVLSTWTKFDDNKIRWVSVSNELCLQIQSGTAYERTVVGEACGLGTPKNANQIPAPSLSSESAWGELDEEHKIRWVKIGGFSCLDTKSETSDSYNVDSLTCSQS